MGLRSFMYVPAHRRRMVDRALGFGEFTPSALDVAMLDVRDGSPEAERAQAREIIAESLGRPSRAGPGPLRYVWVNIVNASLDDDLAVAVRPGLAGLTLTNVETAGELRALADRVKALERARGLPAGSVRLLPSIESALGLLNAHAIASASPRVIGLIFGSGGYALDMDLPEEGAEDAAALEHAAAAMANAAVAARVLPIDGAWTAIEDLAGLRRSALQARRLGYLAKSVIHPTHVDIVNDAFTRSADEIARARRIVEAFAPAEARGEGTITVDGQMVDRPMVARARRIVASEGDG